MACCCSRLAPAGRVASFLRVTCMRSCRPFCCGCPGRMRSMLMLRSSHQTESFERLNRPWEERRERRYPNGSLAAALFEQALECRKGKLFLVRFHSARRDRSLSAGEPSQQAFPDLAGAPSGFSR
jgi:hypothetical protein